MINPLIDLIQTRLQADLVKIVPKAQWHGLPLEQVKTPKLPCVAIYGGKVTFLPIRPDRALGQDCRDFQQEFWIDLLGQNSAQVEQITSLTVGLISLNQQAWLVDCNHPPEDSAHHYQSATIATRHRFRQVQIVGASLDYEEGKVRSRLQCCAIGQLEIIPLNPDPGASLEIVTITGKIGRGENTWANVDDTTQWRTAINISMPGDGSVDSD